MNMQKREANAATKKRCKNESIYNNITLGMKRRVVELHYGKVGNQELLPVVKELINKKKKYCQYVAAIVGMKKYMVGFILKRYKMNDYKVYPPNY